MTVSEGEEMRKSLLACLLFLLGPSLTVATVSIRGSAVEQVRGNRSSVGSVRDTSPPPRTPSILRSTVVATTTKRAAR